MWSTCIDFISNMVCKNEVTDAKVTKISKNHLIKRTSFEIYSTKFHLRIDNILLAVEFKGNFEIFVSKFIKKDWC